MTRIVVALGGNALLRRGESLDQSAQQRNVATAARVIAVLAQAHELVLTHGNGPQVGLLALAHESYRDTQRYTLDVLGSETQGMIGYLLEDALRDALPGRELATLLTQVVVDLADPAFASPTKPIGPAYDEPTARRLAGDRGWTVAEDAGAFRRVVPSPEPQRLLEIAAIRLLVEHGVLVVCAGGGGVPVVQADGAYYGVEAVVDKDFTACLLARALDADFLLLLTDVPAVELGWRTAAARAIREATPRVLRAEHFAPGSMGPKVEAALRFVEATGRRAAIGALEDAAAIVDGNAGTAIVPAPAGLSFWNDRV